MFTVWLYSNCRVIATPNGMDAEILVQHMWTILKYFGYFGFVKALEIWNYIYTGLMYIKPII